MIVCKFGGTSVGDAGAIARTVGIVRSKLEREPVVVVSALAGTTNRLIELAEQAAKGELIVALAICEELRTRHLETIAELLGGDAAHDDVAAETAAMFDELAHLAEALSVLGDLTPRSHDAVASMGERLSAPIVAAAMAKAGIPAVYVDARRVMVTSEDFGRAEPLADDIAIACRATIAPLLREGKVPVLGGYIGATRAGVTSTLGRGGSDYSASLFGAAMEAEAIEIWTDVDGMLTADPRVVSGAQLIGHIRFDEAAELANFGAKVLHPNTIAPAVRRGIPVFVFNSHKPQGTGTRITFDAPRTPVRAIAGKTRTVVVKIRSPRMLATPGALRKIFEVFERNRTSVDVVATSEVSVSVTVDDDQHLDAVVAQLSAFGDVAVERQRGIVALVGAGLGEHTATMARALSALGDLRLHMVSLSATGINLTLIVDGDQVNEAMRRLHAAFFGGAA
ncbi:MAG: lysine-sensitive aspartokinase 3 [Gemmatimonadaceae bacterium]|nr:lysine-sensitive aspartokinase 3 [Gemmatimonadaceae bacterium]MCW5825330.1 lysine-sensitive aspartokinase 3 [Gemmatimonadaceae bacterium]